MSKNTRRAAFVIAAMGLVAAGYAAAGRPLTWHADASGPKASPTAAPAVAATMSLPDFSAIVKQYGPAVVNISTSGVKKADFEGPSFGQIDPGDPFWRFFRRFGGPGPQGHVPVQGLGSGFIVGGDGVILTNAHVVADASEIQVKLTDRREFRARVVGLDKATDVAVLRIDAKDLPTVKLGDPARTQVGEWVLAIGAPFGFESSATAGIVSARARSLPNEGYVPFLQTDVAVNPGNSGGPLFNLAGEVIGINSQIYSRSGGYMGLSFAIPIDVAMKVEGQLLAHGKVTRGRMGVTIQDMNQALAESFGLPRQAGALVSSVEEGSPAARAGLQPGDVILSLDHQEIASSSDLPPRVGDIKPGARAILDVWRKGRHQELTVIVGESPDAQVASVDDAVPHGRLGVTVRPVTPEEQRREDLRGGVVVEGATGPAARAGLQPGDVVLSVSGTPVTGVEQLRSLVAKAGKHVALLVQRGEARIFVPVALG
jgi:serine protease Do